MGSKRTISVGALDGRAGRNQPHQVQNETDVMHTFAFGYGCPPFLEYSPGMTTEGRTLDLYLDDIGPSNERVLEPHCARHQSD